MVYTTVEIVLGVIMSREELEKIVDLDEDGYVEDPVLDTIRGVYSVRIYMYPCCSEARGEQYLIGVPLHTYYRKHGVRCGDCEEYSVCDMCIGITNNGFYDVCAIHNGPVEVPLRHICQHCFADNKKDLQAPEKDLPIVGNQIQGSSSDSQALPCETCGREPDWRFSPENVLTGRTSMYRLLRETLNGHLVPKDKKIAFYYMVDDCLSCT